jgi:PDZ domain
VKPRLPLVLLALALLAPGKPVLAQRSQPGWIGISFEINSDEKGMSSDDPLITDVREGSPAERAGIRVGDRLLAINDIVGAESFANLSDRLRLRVGDRVRIRVERNRRRLDMQLRATERPAELFAAADPSFNFDFDPDSMVDAMFRAMDSLRIRLIQTNGPYVRSPATQASSSKRADVVAPSERETVGAPFEFFVFRGEQHDSLRRAMETLNRRVEALRTEQAQRLSELGATRSRRAADAQADDKLLVQLRSQIEDATRQLGTVRAAMAEAAKATAGFEYTLPVATPTLPDEPPTPHVETFRPLTPYLVGSDRVAGAQVVDLKPELAEYFSVEGGVLIVDVSPGTPADIAGFRPGDVVIRLDKVGVHSVEDLRFGVSQAPDTLPVTLVRQGTRLQVLLRRR